MHARDGYAGMSAEGALGAASAGRDARALAHTYTASLCRDPVIVPCRDGRAETGRVPRVMSGEPVTGTPWSLQACTLRAFGDDLWSSLVCRLCRRLAQSTPHEFSLRRRGASYPAVLAPARRP